MTRPGPHPIADARRAYYVEGAGAVTKGLITAAEWHALAHPSGIYASWARRLASLRALLAARRDAIAVQTAAEATAGGNRHD